MFFFGMNSERDVVFLIFFFSHSNKNNTGVMGFLIIRIVKQQAEQASTCLELIAVRENDRQNLVSSIFPFWAAPL